MKILFFADNFPPEVNAQATRVYERARYWAEWGHEVTVMTTAPNFPKGKLYPGYRNAWRSTEVIDGIRVVRTKSYMSANEGVALRTLDFLSFMVSGGIAALFERRPDVVVSTSPQFFAAVAGWAVGKVRRVPFVFELGDLWPASITGVGAMRPNLFLRLMERVELFLYRQSAAVVALTNRFKQDLVRRHIDPAKIAVVINGVDLPRYSPRPPDPDLVKSLGLEGKFTLGYIGTHGLAHALENVVEAADLLRDDDDFRFLFVGEGASRKKVMELAEAKGLAGKQMIFVPSQPKAAMPSYWSVCDLALIHLKDTPVFDSVIPSKIFEAMGMGRALLFAGPAGEASEIITGEGAGVVLPPEDPAMLAEALRALKADPARMAQLARNSHDAAPRFSRERQARDMMAVLEAVVERRWPGPCRT